MHGVRRRGGWARFAALALLATASAAAGDQPPRGRGAAARWGGGRRDGAVACAAAVPPGKRVEALPRYVASRRGKPDDAAARAARARAEEANRRWDYRAALEALDALGDRGLTGDDVPSVWAAVARGAMLRRVGRLAEAVPEQIEAHYGPDNRKPREDDEIRCAARQHSRICQHRAPFHRTWVGRPKPQKAEACDVDNRGPHEEHRLNDDRGQRVWQHVSHQQAHLPAPGCPSCQHVVGVPQAQKSAV